MVNEHIGKIPKRSVDSHKGNYGKVFILAGSRGMTGAAFLASQGALLSGSGLVTNGIPLSLNQIMEIKLTEVMTLPLDETKDFSVGLKSKSKILDFVRKCDVVAIGPGLGSNAETYKLVRELTEEIEGPLVLDADAINALEGDLELIKRRKFVTVLTPHPGEMARLVGKTIEEVQLNRPESAKIVAELTSAVVCLKGHRTVVADSSGNIYVNETGNSGMATGGMGDVLTGMITSFIGQGIDSFSSTVSAVYLHGVAGDIAAEKKGQFSMTAGDVLNFIPEAFDKAGI
ncbi:MAG: NAD(P)H-hydrate dehydratase [Candidatus Omnitrophota bacterium]|nr:NAD(P)H-hydrate dehydratase [Candidatus Omnitrophota bacterium]